jgi:ribosomal protein L2
MFRRVAAASQATCAAPCALSSSTVRHVAFTTPRNSDYPGHYNPQQKLIAGQNVSLRMTDFYDGYTDSFGVFKEGPPSTLRYEYIRSPEHLTIRNILAKHSWSPFEANKNLQLYSPFYREWVGFSSRDQFGHRSGTMPGDSVKQGHFNKRETMVDDVRNEVSLFPQPRVPKWLATIVNHKFKNGFVGFFLYANGTYACELLTHKMLPRLAYNKPHLGYLPTLGQSVQLSELTYGKEVHSLQMYPGHAGAMCTGPGTAAITLRGSEPNLVPMLLPSREVRLFDTVSYGVFGRRAGLMHRQQRVFGRELMKKYRSKRFRVKHTNGKVTDHPDGGGGDYQRNPRWRLDWRHMTAMKQSTKHFLSGYILRGRQYNKSRTVSELKGRTWGFESRDPLYR